MAEQGALYQQPENKNLLSPTGFRFILNRTPGVNYFTYSVPIPTLSLGEIDTENPNVRLPFPGDKLRFEPLSIRFRVDEDLQNYLEIHNWLLSLGYPEDITKSGYGRGAYNTSGQIYSDGSLLILTSNMNVNLRINFKNLFPISLTELNFDASLSDIEYLEATVTFRYSTYEIERVT